MVATLPYNRNGAQCDSPPAHRLELPTTERERGKLWSDAVFEAVMTLRNQLSSKNEAVAAAAANSILDLERTRMRHDKPIAGSAQPSSKHEVCVEPIVVTKPAADRKPGTRHDEPELFRLGPGQPVTAEVSVTNTGGKLAENVVLMGWWTDGFDLTETSVTSYTLNGKRAWGMGAIAAGETRTLKVKLTPTGNNRATEFRSGFDATFSSSSSDTRSVKVLKPELGLQIVAPEMAMLGQPLTVNIKVKNPGQGSVGKITVQAVMPDGLKHAKAQDLVTDLGVIQAGGSEAIPLDLTANKVGETKGRIRIEAEGCEPIEQEFKVTVMEAKLAVTIHGPKTIYKDWPATYEAVIENQGSYPVKAASLEVKLPTGMTDLRASDKPGHNAGRNLIVWTFDTLQPGEKKTVIWFGFAKQADDLLTTGTVSVGGAPIRRAEWTTKNLGTEVK